MTLSALRKRPSLGALSVLFTLTLAGSAIAEPSAGEKAAAEALFHKGVELMGVGKTAEACEKFDGSNQLDPALGTMLRLADCYESMGRTASAWALFQEAAASAIAQGQSDRNKIASERARSVEQRLSKLQISVDAPAATPGLQVKLNGRMIPSASWDAALPVDPGLQTIEALAPGFVTWKGTVEVAVGPTMANAKVPQLTPEPRLDSATVAAPNEAPPSTPKRSSSQRVIGYVVGGVGLAGLGMGGVFTYLAYDKNQQSLDHCRKGDPGACTEQGTSLRKDAQSAGTIATVATIAGGALVATGITLVLTAPSSQETAVGLVRPKATAVLYPGGVVLRGEF